MRDVIILLVHLVSTLARLLGPGGLRSVVAENLLVKQQMVILNRLRKRAPNLSASDRIISGLCALFMRPSIPGSSNLSSGGHYCSQVVHSAVRFFEIAFNFFPRGLRPWPSELKSIGGGWRLSSRNSYPHHSDSHSSLPFLLSFPFLPMLISQHDNRRSIQIIHGLRPWGEELRPRDDRQTPGHS